MPWYLEGEQLDSSGATVVLEGEAARVAGGGGSAYARRVGAQLVVSYRGTTYALADRRPPKKREGESASDGRLLAPMPGTIVEVLVESGAEVAAGDRLLVLEAMKTQQVQSAPFAGRVVELRVSAGDQVSEGALLARVERSDG